MVPLPTLGLPGRYVGFACRDPQTTVGPSGQACPRDMERHWRDAEE